MAHHQPPPTTQRWIVPALFLVLAGFPCFMHLDAMVVRLWDESRLALNALGMLENGDLLVTHFRGEPDMWNTKPPLLTWVQALFFHILGPSELALRLPSAIAAFLTGWAFVRLSTRLFSAPWLGLIASLLLYTSPGYMHGHVARGGEYDALLTLFMSLSAWVLFRWSEERTSKLPFLFFALLAAGALTKGVQALLFAPGFLVYLVVRKQLIPFLRQRWTWYGALLFIALVGGFYGAREAANPGYLQAVWNNELGGRYGQVLENHKAYWDYYLRNMIDRDFNSWWMLVPCGIVLGLAHAEARIRHWTLLLLCIGTSYFAVVSSAATKLEWYAAPLYPVCCALAAIPLHLLLQFTFTEQWSRAYLRTRALPTVVLFVVFIGPYSKMIDRLYLPTEYPFDRERRAALGYLQKAVRHQGPLAVEALVVADPDHTDLLFYSELLHRQGREVPVLVPDQLVPDMRVMASDEHTKYLIEQGFEHEVLRDTPPLRFYRIVARHE